MAWFAKETLWDHEDSEGKIAIRVVSTRDEMTVEQRETLDRSLETEGKEVRIKVDRNSARGETEDLKGKFERVIDKVKGELRNMGSGGAATVEGELQSPIPLDDEEGGAELYGEVSGGVGEVTISTEEEIKIRVRDISEADELQDRWNELMDGVGNFFQRTRGIIRF